MNKNLILNLGNEYNVYIFLYVKVKKVDENMLKCK